MRTGVSKRRVIISEEKGKEGKEQLQEGEGMGEGREGASNRKERSGRAKGKWRVKDGEK
jgi:hypothetical protein